MSCSGEAGPREPSDGPEELADRPRARRGSTVVVSLAVIVLEAVGEAIEAV
jgi:hypothetical protein